MTKRIVALVSVALLVLALAPSAVSAQDDGKPKIGFLPGIEDPFYRLMEQGVLAAAEDFGMEIAATAFPPAPWGAASQVPLLDAMVARGDLDYIITAPTSAEELIAPLQDAYDQGIGIIDVDTFIGDGDYVNGPVTFPISLIASDNVFGGQVIGHAMAKALGETGEVYIQNTNPETSTVLQRSEGFRNAIAQYPNMTIVDEQWCLDDPVLAAEQTSAVLLANPDVKGIFGVNVFSAEGAGNAVENAGLSGGVQVAAWDATAHAIELLEAGTVTMVLAQQPYDIGYLAVEFAMADHAGVTSIPKHVITGMVVIDRDNMTDPNVSKYFYEPK